MVWGLKGTVTSWCFVVVENLGPGGGGGEGGGLHFVSLELGQRGLWEVGGKSHFPVTEM